MDPFSYPTHILRSSGRTWRASSPEMDSTSGHSSRPAGKTTQIFVLVWQTPRRKKRHEHAVRHIGVVTNSLVYTPAFHATGTRQLKWSGKSIRYTPIRLHVQKKSFRDVYQVDAAKGKIIKIDGSRKWAIRHQDEVPVEANRRHLHDFSCRKDEIHVGAQVHSQTQTIKPTWLAVWRHPLALLHFRTVAVRAAWGSRHARACRSRVDCDFWR